MLPLLRHMRALIVGVLLLSVCSCAQERRAQPKAVDGILDLSDWDFEKDGIVELGGEWRFVWNQFVEPLVWATPVIMVTYYAAQLLMVITVIQYQQQSRAIS